MVDTHITQSIYCKNNAMVEQDGDGVVVNHLTAYQMSLHTTTTVHNWSHVDIGPLSITFIFTSWYWSNVYTVYGH